MPTWLSIVIAAHLLTALAFLVDKYLLARTIPRPSAYAFYVGVLGGASILLLPFHFEFPTLAQAVLDFAAGAVFVVALLAFYTALRRGETSRVVTYIGGTTPLWTLVLAYLFLGERLGGQELLGFGALVIGSALIVRESSTRTARQRGVYAFASLAAFAFATSYILMKAVFLEQDFIPGFVWSRIGAVIASCAILLHRPSRVAIAAPQQRPKGWQYGLFLGGQTAGAIGFIALQYAVSLASPTLVNAMQGVQYAFLFLFVLVLGRRLPQLREQLNRRVVVQKLAAIGVIIIGLALLAQASLS
ncbi:MAG: EamA family transporter [Candidatus Uhrbacteria bacterium]